MNEIVRANQFLEQSEGGLRAAILHADTLRAELAQDGNWEQLTHAIAGLRQIKADLDALLRECENDVARLMPDKKVVVDGIGQIERRTQITRKWESSELLKDLCRLALMNRETGEVDQQLLARVHAILAAAMPITASTGWRVTALKDLGLNEDEYCDKTFGRQTINFTK